VVVSVVPAAHHVQFRSCSLVAFSLTGSTVVYPYEDLTLPPIEVGASIFVSVNRILMRAVSQFNLSMTPWSSSTSEDEIGIWDGSSFLLITKGGVGWWDKAKLLWRYGYWGPKRTFAAVSDLTKTMVGVYDSMWVQVNGPWRNVESLNEALEFDSLTSQVARSYLVKGLKTGAMWADEMVEASTRVNVSVQNLSCPTTRRGKLTKEGLPVRTRYHGTSRIGGNGVYGNRW
jgi:hypothetical protein